MAKNLGNSKRKKNRKINWTGIFALLAILIFVFVYVLSNKSMWGGQADIKKPNTGTQQPAFEIEGKLQFLSDNTTIANFYIEIADEAYSREKGMMYRYYIPDTLGMLFIFPKEDYRFFWMKNTPSSLDIIYASKDFEIVSIHENAPPYSEKTIPSGDPAKYVIELKAGLAARYNIKKGNTFTYQLLK